MRTLLVLSLLLIMAGCIPTLTLQPVWDKQHVVSEPGLEGRWISAEEDSILRITGPSKQGEYQVNFVSDDGVTEYEGHVVRLGDHLILDLCMESDALGKLIEGQAFAPVVPMHFFALIRVEGDNLHLGLLPDDEMGKQIDAGEIKVAASKMEDTLVLTGPTAELQEAIGKLAGNPAIWEDNTFHRSAKN